MTANSQEQDTSNPARSSEHDISWGRFEKIRSLGVSAIRATMNLGAVGPEDYSRTAAFINQIDDPQRRELRKLKKDYTLNRIGAAAMWIPGLDILGESIRESRVSSKINKKRAHEYKLRNGTLMGDETKGYRSNLKSRYQAGKKRLNNQRQIIENLETLLEDSANNTPSL